MSEPKLKKFTIYIATVDGEHLYFHELGLTPDAVTESFALEVEVAIANDRIMIDGKYPTNAVNPKYITHFSVSED